MTGAAWTTVDRSEGLSAPATRVPLSRLVRVELRKLVDTRSGRWLLALIAALTAAVIVILLFSAPPDALTYGGFVNARAVGGWTG